jgi:APA family basic amino acid/polyamine antiporter
MFAWAEDGVFPRAITRIHPRYRTPWIAIVASAAMASVGILGSHLAGDFFLGIDIMVVAMIVNYLLVCLSVVMLPRTNPELAGRMTLLRGAPGRVIGGTAVAILAFLLVVQVVKDLTAPVDAWYFRSTWLWLIVMAMGSAVFLSKWRLLAREGDPRGIYRRLPPQ